MQGLSDSLKALLEDYTSGGARRREEWRLLGLRSTRKSGSYYHHRKGLRLVKAAGVSWQAPLAQFRVDEEPVAESTPPVSSLRTIALISNVASYCRALPLR